MFLKVTLSKQEASLCSESGRLFHVHGTATVKAWSLQINKMVRRAVKIKKQLLSLEYDAILQQLQNLLNADQ